MEHQLFLGTQELLTATYFEVTRFGIYIDIEVKEYSSDGDLIRSSVHPMDIRTAIDMGEMSIEEVVVMHRDKIVDELNLATI